MLEKNSECFDAAVNRHIKFTSSRTSLNESEKDSNKMFSRCRYFSRGQSVDFSLLKKRPCSGNEDSSVMEDSDARHDKSQSSSWKGIPSGVFGNRLSVSYLKRVKFCSAASSDKFL